MNWRIWGPLLAGTQLLSSNAVPARALQAPVDSGTVLHGHASAEQSFFANAYKSGLKALQERQFAQAEQKLTAAVDELRKHNIVDERYVQTRTALGWTCLGLDKAHIAQKFFEDALAHATHGEQAAEGSALAGLAESLAIQGHAKKASVAAHRAIEFNQPLQAITTNSRELGRAYMALGIADSQLGFDEEALAAYKKAIAIFEAKPGTADFDLAEALRGAAQEFQKQGNKAEAKEAAARMYEILDRAAKFDLSPGQSSKICAYWTDGGLRSRQLYDPDYPFKYTWINGLRVAATLVRSDNVVGALISFANCSRNRIELAVGRVQLEETAPLAKHPLEYVPPAKLDMALEEQHISALTWRRQWLNHVEKTRRIPGYLHDGLLDVDNFFANNTFGLYGNWGSIAETRTPLLTREQYLYGLTGHKKMGDLASFLSSSDGYTPTYLEPGDSKTGLVFFRWERFDKSKLKIPVGNVVVEMPFDSAGPR